MSKSFQLTCHLMEHLTLDKALWPSILAASMLDIGAEIEILIKNDVHQLHLDIMDNHYVPNLSFGPDLCMQIHQRFPQLSIDVHLMITPVESMIEQFAKAGASRIAIHTDACIHLHRHLQRIRELGCQAGLVLNPSQGIESLSNCIHQLDYVLVMSVNPGFGGQTWIPEVLEKIQAIHDQYPQLPIMVDGGIQLANIKEFIHHGATEFVVGSALFKASNYPLCIQQYQDLLKNV